MTHEIGHMFTMEHCIYAKCNMNGNNSLQEADNQPLYLCSQCTAKLGWSGQYDVIKRMEGLQQYYSKHRYEEEEKYCEEAIELLKE